MNYIIIEMTGEASYLKIPTIDFQQLFAFVLNKKELWDFFTKI